MMARLGVLLLFPDPLLNMLRDVKPLSIKEFTEIVLSSLLQFGIFD